MRQSARQAPPAAAGALSQLRGANVIGLQYGAAGPVAAVLVSKAGGRYRVQSDSLPALWLAVQARAARAVRAGGAWQCRGGGGSGPACACRAVRSAACVPRLPLLLGLDAHLSPCPLRHLQELTERLAAHYRAADAKPGAAAAPPGGGRLTVALLEDVPLQARPPLLQRRGMIRPGGASSLPQDGGDPRKLTARAGRGSSAPASKRC
jgi:hypothetical protein